MSTKRELNRRSLLTARLLEDATRRGAASDRETTQRRLPVPHLGDYPRPLSRAIPLLHWEVGMHALHNR